MIKAKLPPQDLEAEQAVLGAMMVNKNSVIRVADSLTPEEFYKPAHHKIYETMLELFSRHEPIDIISLTSALKKKRELEKIGGSAYLTELANSVPSSSHIEHYAGIVREKNILRELINTSSEITDGAFGGSSNVEDLLDNIEQKVFAITNRSLPQKFVAVKDELKDAYERIEKLHKGDGALRGVTTGFDGLDHYLSGFQKSDLVILGARPSLGKTALALDIARHAAVKGGVPVGIFSLEMSREQVIDRLISAEAQVPLWRLRTGRLQDEIEFGMIREALDRLSRTPIFVEDSPSPNILQMRAMARRLQAEHDLGLLIVDYLQMIQPRTSNDSVVQQITEISRGLKSLARELNIPVLALSQLSRGVEQREVKIPRLSDLRESGSIEQDADVVMFIYRKDREYANIAPEEQNTAEIIIAKHRNGPLGTVKLKFDPEKVNFKQIDTAYSIQ
ncbi:MAG: replicative DNA helicase [Parcubacteria group bacterium]|nr:replicative DNA helicase [Parcubacteria group bacterium]